MHAATKDAQSSTVATIVCTCIQPIAFDVHLATGTRYHVVVRRSTSPTPWYCHIATSTDAVVWAVAYVVVTVVVANPTKKYPWRVRPFVQRHIKYGVPENKGMTSRQRMSISACNSDP